MARLRTMGAHVIIADVTGYWTLDKVEETRFLTTLQVESARMESFRTQKGTILSEKTGF